MKRMFVSAMLFVIALPSFASFRDYEAIAVDRSLQAAVERVARETLAEYAASGLKEGNLSIVLVDLSGSTPVRATFDGSIPFYPASVVKLFFLVVMYDQWERGHLELDPELTRAATDMIVASSNDATAYVVDRITNTTGGPELEGRAWRKFEHRRNLVNRYFREKGYDISASAKTWCEGPYGREMQLLGRAREHRNRITAEAAAAVMNSIVRHRLVSSEACEAMMDLMQRPIPADGAESPDDQVVEFSGERLPAGSRLWSKAGLTSEVRHDVAYVELPNGSRYVLAVMTRGASHDTAILPSIGSRIAALFQDR